MSQIVRLTKTVTNQLGDLISGRPDMVSDPSPFVTGTELPSGGVGLSRMYADWIVASKVPTDRKREMKYYDYLEREISDVRKALDAYATMAVTGNLAGGGRAAYTIRMLDDEDRYPDELKNRLNRMESMLQRIAYHTVRTMVKYGSYTPEIIPGVLDDNRLGVAHINPIGPGTIFRYVKPDGRDDPNKYWIQIVNDKPVSPGSIMQTAQNGELDKAAIAQWRLPHFAVWTNVVDAEHKLLYGTSILQPFGSIGLKVHGTLDAMVLARLTRAAMRYIWKIDVTDIKTSQKQIQRRMQAWMRKLSRDQTLINSQNQADSYQKPPTPDQDFFVPSGDGLHWDLDKIDGDMNLGRVTDVELLVRFYFGALGVPPEYLGHERSQGGRSNLSQIDIHFARTVRHIQMFGAAGFEHLVWVDMLLGGWDPREYPIACVPPPIGARDDLLQAQIRALQSAVVAQLGAAGMRLDLNPEWVLRTFLNMDEELEDLDEGQIDQLFEKLQMSGGGPSDGPPGGQRQNVEAAIQRVHQLFGPIIRENIRMLGLNQDAFDGLIYKHHQPTVEDLKNGVSSEILR